MRLVRGKFEEWLKSKPADEIVGASRDTCGCPLARFYYDGSDGCEVVIHENRNGGGYVIDRGHSKRPIPDWAAAFVYLIDGDGYSAITADRALKVLSQISF